MIFVGDIAHPFKEPPMWSEMERPWEKQAATVNLEGALVSDSSPYLLQSVVFNNESVCDGLRAFNAKVLNLSNNHIMDIPAALDSTLKKITEAGFLFTGAGPNLDAAMQPAFISDRGTQWLLLGCGWETIQSCPATSNKPGVNPFDPPRLLNAIKEWRRKKPKAVIVLMPHWNYELELYPQPAHRQFAMAAIDAGVDAVIGHHPHRVGGIELYNGRPIVYSLGNWWMPHGMYFGGRLKFGDETLLQLALEWNPGQSIVCHWFKYSRDNHKITYKHSEPLVDSVKIQQLTSFACMDHKDYQKWFSTHRVKRKALPIYRDYRHQYRNNLKDWYVKKRHSGLMLLEKSGLREYLKL